MESLYGLVVRVAVLIGFFVFTKAQEECKKGGCFPATGDLLVGREDKLKSSSTCGVKTKEQYCIVSFLDRSDKCFICDSSYAVDSISSRRNFYNTSHLPKYIVTSSPQDRLKGWWQSENGVQDVTIQLDLEVEFVFTHLIMTFKTFRPKAMYVERSWNYGRSWSDYRYFAFDCAKSFPKIRKGAQRDIDDVICEERYSRVEPSTEGEVVMKVLDPVVQGPDEDPYSLKVQNLLKLTNLRIVFKELHTFGDDVLGDSPEVNQKYYYALYEIVVRGSCSCYGHAEQCIPIGGTLSNLNMVHGNCDCKHDTTGRNCEKCKAGFNDEPWRPAYKDQLHICRKCNCNGHTTKCHFDPAVYNATGHSSGGVCDDCLHNTAGRQCEQCKPLYYRDPYRDITDTRVCKPCDCDPAGSFGGGECETVGDSGTLSGGNNIVGGCICKANVVGPRCDRCKDGYWNLLESHPDGCQSCHCEKNGTVSRNTCDQKTGNCRCKRNVKGLTCSKCIEGYWNLGTSPEGCDRCGCDTGGSRNQTCDDVTGMCSCRPFLTGRKCDKVRPGYHFPNLDHTKYEGENAVPSKPGTPYEVVRKIKGSGGDNKTKWTGDGYLKIKEGSEIDFTRVRVPVTGHYNVIIRYDKKNKGDWSDVRVTVNKEFGGSLGGDGCPKDDITEEYRYPTLPSNKEAVEMQPSMCFQKGATYKVKIDFRTTDGNDDGETLIDSIVLIPNVNKLGIFDGRDSDVVHRRRLYEKYNCRQYYVKANIADSAPEICKDIQFSISSIVHNGALPCQCDPVGTKTNGSSVLTCKMAGGQCPCKPGVIGRTCNRCSPGYFGYGPKGCTACDCDITGSTSQFCHDKTGKCTCKRTIKGRKCDSCPPFFYDFPYCKMCECNSHSVTCDAKTGRCLNCRQNTAGPNCDQCAVGYYGDAHQGTDTDCQRCQCPGGSSGNQFSSSCVLSSNGRGVCNNCTIGYEGNQCDKCADGYYGNPLKAGGSCKKCDCGGNIDFFADGKCDPKTGKCFNCVNYAVGEHCEKCKPKYFGNARNQSCRACVCNSLGTDPTKGGICNRVTGQCPCLKNVDGSQCHKCAAGFYNLASGGGCLECKCHKDGSLEKMCNQLDGQCRCRVGFGGRDCSQCEDLSWGNPMNGTCKACGCNQLSSESLQCDRNTGKCKCKNEVVGDKCDMCAPGTAGMMPECQNCHTCNDQWEDIVIIIEKKISNMMKIGVNKTFNASASSSYKNEIMELKRLLIRIESMFRNHRVDSATIKIFIENMNNFRGKLGDLNKKVKMYFKIVANTTTRNTNANDELDKLKFSFDQLKKKASQFRVNITKIVEGNIGGALNSTLDSLRRSRAAQKVVISSKEKIKDSKKLRKKMKKEIINGAPTFDEVDKRNNKLIDRLNVNVTDLEKKLKELNKLLCGADDACGGCTNSGCGTCGAAGSICTGVKQLAKKAVMKATQAKEMLLQKKVDAKKILELVTSAEKAINESRATTKVAEEKAGVAKKIGEDTKLKIIILIKDITAFLNTKYHFPNQSEAIARETLGLNISLTPAQVRTLAEKIRTAVANLTTVKKILNESKADYDEAIALKKEALKAKKFAIKVMNKTQKILDTLEATRKLQNLTSLTIIRIRYDMNLTSDILKQIRLKIKDINTDLNIASTKTDTIESENGKLKEKFKENREKLGKAEVAYEVAKKKAEEVKSSSDSLKGNYNTTKEKLNAKAKEIDGVTQRILALVQGAEAATRKVTIKTTIIDDLTVQYTKNEKRVRDLSDELRKLAIKAKYIRDRLKKLSLCHSNCNPLLTDKICQEDFKKLNTKETAEVKALGLEISSRSS